MIAIPNHGTNGRSQESARGSEPSRHGHATIIMLLQSKAMTMMHRWMRLFACVGWVATALAADPKPAPQKTFADRDKYIDFSH